MRAGPRRRIGGRSDNPHVCGKVVGIWQKAKPVPKPWLWMDEPQIVQEYVVIDSKTWVEARDSRGSFFYCSNWGPALAVAEQDLRNKDNKPYLVVPESKIMRVEDPEPFRESIQDWYNND